MSAAGLQAVLRDYIAGRVLPDGMRLVAVGAMTFGKGRIIIGDEFNVLDAWCFDSLSRALRAYVEWDPDKEEEPSGWMRHPQSGRRRPDGDASKEHIHF